MCIMEVRSSQRSDTIAQAMAHNTSTIERDLDMFEALLSARKEGELLLQVQHAHEHLRHAYAGFLGVFCQELAHYVQSPEGHVHEHVRDEGGQERSLVSVAHRDASRARRFETR